MQYPHNATSTFTPDWKIHIKNNDKKSAKNLHSQKKSHTFAEQNQNGAIAQLVEQRTENPCVPGSIPGGTTEDR